MCLLYKSRVRAPSKTPQLIYYPHITSLKKQYLQKLNFVRIVWLKYKINSNV